MWVVPKTLSAFVPDMVESNLDFDSLASILERSVMWRSKHSLKRTWLQRLKRIKWMQLLSGRILKPSMASRFVEKYTGSLAVIRAKENRPQESEKEQRTLDGFGRILRGTSKQLSLFGVSLRTLEDILRVDSPWFTEAYDLWVTRLRQGYLVRLDVARGTLENDYSFLPTPTASDWKHTGTVEAAERYLQNGHQTKITLLMQLKGFGTPHLQPLEEMMGLEINWTDLGSWATE